MDLPTLQASPARTWGKEDELKQLKSDLAILAPTHEVPDDRMRVNKEEQDGEEVKRDERAQSQSVEAPAQSTGSKESLVAEPIRLYKRAYPSSHVG